MKAIILILDFLSATIKDRRLRPHVQVTEREKMIRHIVPFKKLALGWEVPLSMNVRVRFLQGS